jgi:hypothetical protein
MQKFSNWNPCLRIGNCFLPLLLVMGFQLTASCLAKASALSLNHVSSPLAFSLFFREFHANFAHAVPRL